MTYPQSDATPVDPGQGQGYAQPNSGQFPAQAYPQSDPFPAQGYPQSGQYPAQGYQQMPAPMGYQPAMAQNGIGTGGFVTGLLGLIFCWFNIIGIILCIIGISLSGVGISKANKGEATNKGLATAGLVCGVIGLALNIILLIAVASAFSTI